MILIFGGAYQGKLDYAIEKYGARNEDIFLCAYGDTSVPEPKRVIYGLEKWIYALVQAEQDYETAVKNALPEWKDSIIICNDVSSGVVPTDPVCRKWRDAAGRTISLIGACSDEVVRVFCGIGTRLE